MQAWWIRALSSAYGSTVGWATGPWPLETTATAAPFSPWRVRRSWSPIDLSAPRQAQPAALGLLPLRLLRRHGRLRECEDGLGVVRPGLRKRRRVAPIDTHRDDAVGRDLVRDLHLQRSLDLALRQADLRVGSVEHETDVVRREREQLERLQREPDVLQRRDVETAQDQQLVG